MDNIPEKIKQNMIFVREQMSRLSPRMARQKSLRLIQFVSDIAHPVYNCVIDYQIGLTENISGDIKKATEHYRSRQLPFVWFTWSHDSNVAELREALKESGLTKVDTLSGMSLSLSDWTYDAPAIPGFTVKTIRTREEMAWFRDIVPSVFKLDGEAGEVLTQISEDAALGENSIFTHYAGFLDGQLAVTATAVHDRNALGIYNVATLDNFRRKGLGSALMAHALRNGQAAGKQLAVLLASKMGAGVYRAIGFVDDVEIEVYLG